MAEIKLRFEIDDNGTVKVLDDVKEKTKGVGEEAEKSSQRATRAFDALKAAGIATAAAVGAATVATVAAVGRQFQQIDELAKVSRATGVAVKDLSGLQVAADLAGVSLQGLGTSLGLFSRKLVDAQRGGTSAKLFDALGIDVNSGRSTQQLLEDVADRFAELGTGAESTALAIELFGRSGARMINLLEGGGAAIRAAREEAALFGLVVGGETAAAVEQVNDDISRLQSVAVGFSRDLVKALAPSLAEVSMELVDWAKGNREVLAQDLAGYLTNLAPVIRTVADGFIFANGVLDAFAEGIGNLIGTGNVYASSEIAQQVARRYTARGIAIGSLGDAPGRMTRIDGDAPMTSVDGSGQVAAETTQVAREEERITETMRSREELLARINAAMAQGNSERERAARSETYAPGAMPLPFVAAIEEGQRQMALLTTQAAEFPVAVQDWTPAIEEANRAAVNLGDLLADSLTGAVDSLLARDGGFDLGDTLEGLGQAAMSRMVSAMLREKLKFDVAFQDNFLGLLPRIATQGGDLIARGFGSGLQSLAQQSANLGSVITGSLSANGVVSFGNGGQSVDALNFGGMTDAATGQAMLASGGAPLAQSAAGAASMGAPLAGMLGTVGIAGTLGLGSLFGSLAGGGAFGSRAEANSGMFGASVGAALAAPFTFGLAPLLLALFGNRGPSASERRRMAMGDAFRDAGIFPTLAFAKDPTREFRDAPMPGFLGEITPEVSALSLLLGGTMNDAQFRLPGTIGSRASVLGLTQEQVQRELRRVARTSGVSIDEAVGDLSTQFLEYQINRKGSAMSQEEYLDLLTGTIDLLASDLPRGIDASVIALANLEQVGGRSVLNLEAFNAELERQQGIAMQVSGGLTGAAGTLAGDLLRGDANARATFGNAVLDAALGGVGQNVVTQLFADGGPLADLEEALVAAVIGGDPDALRGVLDGTGDAFGLINARLAEFLPIFEEFRQEIEDATGATRQGFLDQRDALRDRIADARFNSLTPAQQEAELRRRIRRGRADALELLTDGLESSEIDPYNRAISSVAESGFSLLSAAGRFAYGSPERRAAEQEAYNALGFAESALSIAAESLDANTMNVQVMYVNSVVYRDTSAITG